MRTRLFLPLALALAAALPCPAPAAEAAHGVGVVVIDPGHGGKFPGAHYGGVYEKDLTLQVALKLGKLITQEMPGVKVVYTRTTDKELGTSLLTDLQARATAANRAGGDLFISIHANAAPKAPTVRGVETLIMGETPKEQRYNENALYESNREDLIDMSDQRTAAIVRAYIQNLQFTYGEYSMTLARCIQNNYSRTGRHSRGVKQQLLRVLYATDMPSVLTEIGFMTHAQELAYMKSEKGQNEIARSICRAVQEYSAYVLGTRASEEEPATAEKQPGDRSKNAPKAESAQASAAQPTAPDPAQQTEPSDGPVRFAIQILSSAASLKADAAQFGKYRGRVQRYTSAGSAGYKYCIGDYATHEAAEQQLPEVRKAFPDAFIVRYRGSQLVTP